MIARLFSGYDEVVISSLFALLPLLVILGLAQRLILQLPAKRFRDMLVGVALVFVGLTLFLQGVNAGYIPLGNAMGYVLADRPDNWILVPIGLVLGFAITLAEPSIYVLTQEIEKVSGGFVRRRLLLSFLAVGVAASIALAMAKLLFGLPLWVILAPGYILALILARFAPSDFVAMAFDSGGVATGTMTATFILSLAIGVATRLDETDPLLDGFGIIALVALTPIIMVLILGLIIGRQREIAED